jgi:A/G-specific adenine glycosylase
MVSKLAIPLIAWYKHQARKLPWRENPGAYAVWVSEIMAQQTRLETVIPYYQSWMERFPNVFALAQARLQDVLSIWEGLGYYQRARNMHRAAMMIVETYGGKIPQDIDELRKLPGIGRYTAGAIASIAFGLDEPVLDGNVRRVLTRAFDIAEPVESLQVESRLWVLARENLPSGEAGVYNQALMDLGALICTPHNPDCAGCPLAKLCLAKYRGVQEQRPVRLPKSKIPHHRVTAAVIYRDQKVLIAQRPLKGLLGGLWEFPGGKIWPEEAPEACLRREIREELGVDVAVGALIGTYKHAYTHFRVTLQAYCCHLAGGMQPRPIQVKDLRWVDIERLAEYPMGKIDRSIASQLSEEYLCTS